MFQTINRATNSPANSNPLNKEYVVKVNFIEIYKEECKDLLDNTEKKDIQIREDETGMLFGVYFGLCLEVLTIVK